MKKEEKKKEEKRWKGERDGWKKRKGEGNINECGRVMREEFEREA